MIELTLFTKSNGPLTKRISLAEDGSVISDGSACIMPSGIARRVEIDDVEELESVIEEVRRNQAIALGALRADLPAKVKVVTKQKLSGTTEPDVIARTSEFIDYRSGQPALALLDFDTKGMPPAPVAEVERRGGFRSALVSALPALRGVARVTRRSTSAGLLRSDTGEPLPESNGRHVYILVADGADVERFLKALHARCWLAGLGWMTVGAGGQLLERSIVDRMVGAPERLVFEGAPILEPPLQQGRRPPMAVDGGVLDTAQACPPLTIVEAARLRELRAKEEQRLASASARARAAFINVRAKRLARRTGISERTAAQIITRQCEGVLLPDVVLPFDDEDLTGTTVAKVLADPGRFEGATLADPLEGVEYGLCKARIMRRSDGTPWIHSFAHGRTVYELKLDARAMQETMKRAARDMVIKTLLDLAVNADLNDAELEDLRNLVAERTRTNRRTVAAMLKAARDERAAQRSLEERERRLAERRDPRPRIDVPFSDDEWLPQMGVLNEIMGSSTAVPPPTRDIDGVVTWARKIVVPGTHAFQDANANQEEEE